MIPAQLAQRLCTGFLKVRNPAEIPSDEQQLILDALNNGFNDYFSNVPPYLKQQKLGARFGGGYQQSMTVTNGSRVIVPGDPVSEGATLVIPGDTVYNHTWLENGVQMLEVPYGGPTGTPTATIYRDVFTLPSSIEGFITPPRDPTTGIEYLEVNPGGDFREIASPVTGYRIERAGVSHILRLMPLPAGDVPVMMEVVLNAPHYTELASLTDLSSTAPTSQLIPVSDADCVTYVMPLAAWHLIGHPLWREATVLDAVQARYEKAIRDLDNMRPHMGARTPLITASCP